MAVLILATDLLEYDGALVEDAAILLGYLGRLLLSHYFEKLFHVRNKCLDTRYNNVDWVVALDVLADANVKGIEGSLGMAEAAGDNVLAHYDAAIEPFEYAIAGFDLRTIDRKRGVVADKLQFRTRLTWIFLGTRMTENCP